MPTRLDKHVRIGKYLKDVIFAANDGIVTTFAVIAGVAGADLPVSIILIIGFASLLADGFSMATGNYLGTTSEIDFYKKESDDEAKEIEETPKERLQDVREILIKKGYAGENLNEMTRLISINKNYWRDFMMHEEMEMFSPKTESAFKNGLATFVSFTLAGSVTLIPYLFLSDGKVFIVSTIAGAITLFTVGAFRKFFSEKNWFILGMEMLIIGGSASILAYFAGSILAGLVG